MAQDVHALMARMGGGVAVRRPEPRPFRSWPQPRSRLERLAFAAGLDDEVLRERLRTAIEQRRREA